MVATQQKTAPSFNEFVVIVSLMMALVAFSIFFAMNALSLGFASFLNSRFVMRFGMIHMVRWVIVEIKFYPANIDHS
ncbi:MAG: hypothetical protein K0B14_17820 [Anaerolineaceae bacterium]|nr:hypothetical protein [Anaerolineaceae bacterium]